MGSMFIPHWRGPIQAERYRGGRGGGHLPSAQQTQETGSTRSASHSRPSSQADPLHGDHVAISHVGCWTDRADRCLPGGMVELAGRRLSGNEGGQTGGSRRGSRRGFLSAHPAPRPQSMTLIPSLPARPRRPTGASTPPSTLARLSETGRSSGAGSSAIWTMLPRHQPVSNALMGTL